MSTSRPPVHSLLSTPVHSLLSPRSPGSAPGASQHCSAWPAVLLPPCPPAHALRSGPRRGGSWGRPSGPLLCCPSSPHDGLHPKRRGWELGLLRALVIFNAAGSGDKYTSPSPSPWADQHPCRRLLLPPSAHLLRSDCPSPFSRFLLVGPLDPGRLAGRQRDPQIPQMRRALVSWPRLVPSAYIASSKGPPGCCGLGQDAAALAPRRGAGGSCRVVCFLLLLGRGRGWWSRAHCLSCSLTPAH